MIADTKGKLWSQDGIRQRILEANLVNTLCPVSQAESGEQSPLYCLFHS